MGYQWDHRKKFLGSKWKWTHNEQISMGHSESSPEREVHSITGLPQEARKMSNKQSKFTPKITEITITNKAQWAEGNKIRVEINDKETKKKKSMKSIASLFEKINQIDEPLTKLINKRRSK